MRRSSVLALAVSIILTNLSIAHAHTASFPIVGGKLLVKGGDPAKRKFVFKSTKQPNIVPLHDPAVDELSILVVATGPGGARTPLIRLTDAPKWKSLGNPPGVKGYSYKDKLLQTGGTKVLNLKPGQLAITAQGPNFPWDPIDVVDTVQVIVRVGEEQYCAAFDTFTINEPGKISAKANVAPAACPAQLCGNGEVEAGEACDDGNLDDNDSCHNDCTAGACSGTSFPSTWAAIQQKVFTEGGCNQALCHGGVFPAGGLDLSTANAYANLVNVPGTLSPTLDRIEPGDQDLSFLYLKLATATIGAPQYDPAVLPGSPMPAGGLPALSTDRLEALRLWIRAGASDTGSVEGTGDLLGGCLPPPTPSKIPPLDPPAPADGVQFYSGGWALPAQSEHEVCYATYYDVSSVVPPSAVVPCPSFMSGPLSSDCFRYEGGTLAQDPQSHHSIIHMYTGIYPWTDPGFFGWSCLGGPYHGQACDPTQLGVSASVGGAECGPRAQCTSAVRDALACIGYGPPDASQFGSKLPTWSGSQEPLYSENYAPGVYNVLPVRGIIFWNSHAFNLTTIDTTMEQYQNVVFATPANQLYQAQGIFDDSEIFVQNVPPFETREYCRTFTLPQNSHLFHLSSHVHKRGTLFRWWAPPNASCTASGGCLPGNNNGDPPVYVSTQYNDPVQLYYDPPLFYGPITGVNRRYKFCAVYDNGASDMSKVKRRSTSPPGLVGGPCAASETRCIGGPQHNQLCNGDNAFCDSSLGAGDGDCDACPLLGGVTTEDEMFIGLGTYYISATP